MNIEDYELDDQSFYTKIKDNHINVNQTTIHYNECDYTPLHLAVILNKYSKLYILHHYFKAKINVHTEKTKTTPLHDSVIVPDDANVMLYLLINGAYVDSQDTTGATPVYYAVLERQYGKTVMLKEFGADLSIRDNENISAYDMFAEWNRLIFLTKTVNGVKEMFSPVMTNFFNRIKEKYMF